jgi:OsmC-like protein
MDLSAFGVRATAGSLRDGDGVVLPHTWTEAGVVAGPATNGAQVLHLSVALCVLNDTFREAGRLGIAVDGVAVEADGGFDDGWRSTGVEYAVTVDSTASADDLARLLAVVDEVAEIPRALRAGTEVSRRT